MKNSNKNFGIQRCRNFEQKTIYKNGYSSRTNKIGHALGTKVYVECFIDFFVDNFSKQFFIKQFFVKILSIQTLY